MLRCAILLGAALMAGVAAAQAPSDAARAVERWQEHQRQAEAALGQLQLVERITRRVEGPHAEREVRTVFELFARRGDVDRVFREGAIDGEPIDPERAARHAQRLKHVAGTEFQIAGRAAISPGRHLRDLHVVEAERTHLGGTSVWRARLVPRSVGGRIEEATVWVTTGERPRLLRTEFVVRGSNETSELTITTLYDVIAGPGGILSVPRSQEVEAVLQQQRRWRTYTVFVHSESRFDSVRAVWRDAPPRRR